MNFYINHENIDIYAELMLKISKENLRLYYILKKFPPYSITYVSFKVNILSINYKTTP